MGLNPSAPDMTFLLVMLHTGTMFAVVVYFWKAWRRSYFSGFAAFLNIVVMRLSVIATLATAAVGFPLKLVIEKIFLNGGEVESLFDKMPLIAAALAAAGALILYSGSKTEKMKTDGELDTRRAGIVGAVQGLCLPFRGFSRSGATISTGLLLGVGRVRMEEFSFALAVVLTPPVLAKEFLRLHKYNATAAEPLHWSHLVTPGLVGMACSFVAGLVALKFLGRLLESGRWKFFGYNCLVAAIALLVFSLV